MTFSLTSWNILANSYIRPEYYPNTPAGVLEPERRRRALLASIELLRADVLCLQEVEEDAFSDIRRALGPDYQSRFLRKSGRKPDGCATLWRGFDLDAAEDLRYSDGSGHVALILRLRRGAETISLANTHLKWSPPEERVGAAQMAELIEAMPSRPRIICGDLNVTPESEVVRLLRDQGMAPVHPETAFTCNSNRTAKQIDFIFHDRSLSARPLPLARIAAESALPGEECPSDHLPIEAEFL